MGLLKIGTEVSLCFGAGEGGARSVDGPNINNKK